MKLSQLLSRLCDGLGLDIYLTSDADLANPEDLINYHAIIGDAVFDACQRAGLSVRASAAFSEWLTELHSFVPLDATPRDTTISCCVFSIAAQYLVPSGGRQMAIIIEFVLDADGNPLSIKQSSLSEPDLEAEGEHEIFEDVADPRVEEDFARLEKREWLERLMEQAKLTLRERMVLHLYAIGESFTEMGRKLNLSRQRAQAIYSSAIRKLQRAVAIIGE